MDILEIQPYPRADWSVPTDLWHFGVLTCKRHPTEVQRYVFLPPIHILCTYRYLYFILKTAATTNLL